MMRLCSGPHFMPVLALILLHPFTDTDACDAESNGISRGKLAALAKLATSRSATNGDERNSMSRHEPQLISTPTGVAWVSGGQTIGAKPIPEVLTGATTLIVVPSDHAGPAAHGGHNSSAFLFDYVALGGSMVVMLGALLLSPRSTRTSVKSLVRRAPHHSWPHLVRGPTLARVPYCGRLIVGDLHNSQLPTSVTLWIAHRALAVPAILVRRPSCPLVPAIYAECGDRRSFVSSSLRPSLQQDLRCRVYLYLPLCLLLLGLSPSVGQSSTTTLAGSGAVGNTPGVGVAARFSAPEGIAISPSGDFALVRSQRDIGPHPPLGTHPIFTGTNPPPSPPLGTHPILTGTHPILTGTHPLTLPPTARGQLWYPPPTARGQLWYCPDLPSPLHHSSPPLLICQSTPL